MGFSLGEYQDIFLEEADEQLQELNQNLLQLEKDPNDSDIINNIFRAAHSLKSSAAFVGLNSLSDLAHKMENLLQGIRDKTMDVTPGIVSVLFRCFDVINSVIETVGGGEEPTQDLAPIIREIENVSERKGEAAPSPVRPEAAPAEPRRDSPKLEFDAGDKRVIRGGLESGLACCEVTVFLEADAMMKSLKLRLVLNNLEHIAQVIKVVPDLDDVDDPEKLEALKAILLTSSTLDDIRRACDVDQVQRVDFRRISLIRKDEKLVLKFHDPETIALTEEAPAARPASAPPAPEERPSMPEAPVVREEVQEDETEVEDSEADRGVYGVRKDDRKSHIIKTVKVSVDKLDLLLNNVGELVIANSGFYRLYEEMRRQSYDKTIINEFKNRMEQMSRIAKDLQSSIMKTRMVPIGQVFSRFNRMVRDLSLEFNKRLQLKVIGEETELDKKVIDAIGEPLMHLIRNAVDHGIETVEERKRMNKGEMGTITLNAFQGGNQIFVEVSDDGRGLNGDAIRAHALKKGIVTKEMLANMDNDDIYQIIFTAGFSTAEKITDISGRGVGMNVVKEIVTELNGNVSIETEPGMGTRFVMAFPLTLAIIPAIMVKVRNEIYAIPLSDVIETIKIAENEITTIEGHEVINLRGEILSLIRLNEFVGTDSALSGNDKIPVVVVGFGNRKIGMMVDFLEGKQEIVIKSLEQNYRTVEGLAGASILGDGSICLILDIASMINKVISDQDVLTRRDRQRILDGMAAGAFTSASGATEKVPAEVAKPVKAAEVKPPAAPKQEPPAAVKPAPPPEAPRQEAAPAPVVSTPVEPAAVVTPPEPVKEGAAPKAREELSDEELDRRVKEALGKFKDELKETVRSTLADGKSDEHIKKELGLTDQDVDSVRIIANIGITEAAESLSKILGKQIDLSIPEVAFMSMEAIPATIGDVNSVYIGVYMPLVGEVNGTVLFSLQQENGFELIDMLYGSSGTGQLTEDGESALREVTNIIGSSVVNVFADRLQIVLKPTVPTIIHDYMQAMLDSILVMHNISNDYALVMETDFFYGDDRVIGNLLILPDTESLKFIVGKLREYEF
jgi:two-component system chemotaxis sensor kinase CheA